MGAKIQSLDVWNKTFIITTGNIDQNDVSTYLKQKFREREFSRGSIFKTYAGAHGYRDGRLGDRESDIKQLRSDVNSQLRCDVEDAREDDLFQDENSDALHERLSECTTERIMENVASKDLYGQIRSAIIELRQDEEMQEIIEEMGYNLLNPDLIGKDKRDQELQVNHEQLFDDIFNSMTARNEPYVIFLAVCLSDRNELTNYMGELGIISACTMKSERGDITGGRWFKLDEGQEEILKKIRKYHKYRGSLSPSYQQVVAQLDRVSAELSFEKGDGHEEDHTKAFQLLSRNLEHITESSFKRIYKKWRKEDHHRPKNLLLTGSFGTGKTILLVEAVRMRIAHYRRMRVPLRIIFCVWHDEANNLYKDLQNKYFPSLKDGDGLKEKDIDVEFFGPYESNLCRKYNIRREGSKISEMMFATKLEDINALLFAISEDSNKKKTLLFVDEICMLIRNESESEDLEENKLDFSNLSAEYSNVDFFIAVSPLGGRHDFVAPESHQVLGRQLLGRHRSNIETHNLLMHLMKDWCVNDTEDEIDKRTLPKGKMPLVILRNENEVSNSEVFGFIDRGGWIEEGQSVTVIDKDLSNISVRNLDVVAWCEKDRVRRKCLNRYWMTGCEDEVIILFEFMFESISRAREMLIIVTDTIKSGVRGLLDRYGIIDHQIRPPGDCNLGADCPVKGQQLIEVVMLHRNEESILECTKLP